MKEVRLSCEDYRAALSYKSKHKKILNYFTIET